MNEPALDGLVDALRRLPGVGVKSAQRMAFHLLQHDRDGARRLAGALGDALERMRHCQRCHTYTEAEVCATCRDASRNPRLLCVVETPADQAALERTGTHRGLYFVLMGRLSPLDASARRMGPRPARPPTAAASTGHRATNFTAEGEALRTAGLRLARRGPSERLARGVPPAANSNTSTGRAHAMGDGAERGSSASGTTAAGRRATPWPARCATSRPQKRSSPSAPAARSSRPRSINAVCDSPRMQSAG